MDNKKKWYGFVPNMITTFNLLSGFCGIVFAFDGRLKLAASMIVVAAAFDFFDGLAARILKVTSPMGKELDSLSDVVSFGVLPGILLFQFFRIQLGIEGVCFLELQFDEIFFLASSMMIPAFSSLRLAKFNIDTRQSDAFIGLPTPANALFFGALVWSLLDASTPYITIQNYVLSVLAIIFSLLLVSEKYMLSLKFKNLKFAENKARFILIFSAIVFFALWQVQGIAITILFYIVLSLLNKND